MVDERRELEEAVRPAAMTRLSTAWIAAIGIGCAAPELGDLPARCADGMCPEGYDCIHGVCAKPGTAVPITVAELSQLRGVDLKIVPQTSTALVTWQTYPYSGPGEQIVGARVSADGTVSRELALVSSFVADPESNEPYYDLLLSTTGEMLIAISAPALLGDPSANPRLITYRATLPPEGQEAAGVQFGAAWNEELRLSTIGYGAVSKPKLLRRDNRVELGYFQTRTEVIGNEGKTIGELVVIQLDESGGRLPGAPETYPARGTLPVAVGVEGAFVGTTGAWWVLDEERPSVLLLTNDGAALEMGLERLSTPGEVAGASLLSVEPSKRTGEKLPTSPVDGPASLHKTDHVLQGQPPAGLLMPSKVGELKWVRDTPRPAWVSREGKAPIVVSPGKDIRSPTIGVYTIDTAAGTMELVASIERFSTSDVDAVAATVVGGNLFVAWSETASEAKVRAAVIPEP
jgi:hypothetical protein